MSSVKTLNNSQQEAVLYHDGPLLIVAGAGTGKTTVITEKIAHIIQTNLAQPEEILALTFTDKAAGEMQARIDELVDIGYTEITIGTFHQFCQRVLQEFGLHIGLPRQFQVVTDTETWLLVHEHLYDFPLNYYRPLGNPTSYIHELIRHISKCKDELVSEDEYLEFATAQQLDTDIAPEQDDQATEQARIKEIAEAYHVYNQLLLHNNSLDFGDLIFYTVTLLRERPEVLRALKQRYRYILVDEFQDVNYAQYELVRLLVDDTACLTVVGDDDQSIYAFRGASVSNILRFKEDYPTAKEVILSENYRSAQAILDLAYQSIQQNNPDRLEVKLQIDKRLIARQSYADTTPVVHFHKETLADEVETVIEEILRLKQMDASVTWDDIAILVRANGHAEPFLHALEQARIPYEFLAAAGLYRQPIVIDCFSFFKVITNYHDSPSMFRLWSLPMFSLDHADLQTLLHYAKKKSISYTEAIGRAKEWNLSPEAVLFSEKLLKLLQEARGRMTDEKPTVVLLKFLEDAGYLQYLTNEAAKGHDTALREIEYLRQFLECIATFEKTKPEAKVYQFVEYYSYLLQSGDEGKLYQPTDTPESVQIMTVHAAKGLEFKYVFVVNMVEERFPTRRRGEGIALPSELVKEQLPAGDYHYQEERRLFYVAVTRAKERLYLTSASNYGGVREKKVSRFLLEIGFESASKKQKKDIATKELEMGLRVPIQRAQTNPAHTTPQLPTSFSFSQIQTYQTCPYKYQLAHILKIPTKGSGAFSFGSTMHLTMQRFYERVQEMNVATQGSLFASPEDKIAKSSPDNSVQVPTLEELLALFERSWIDDWYESKRQREQYKEKGKEILRLFYASQEGQWSIPLTLEESFKISVGGYKISGRIDRIDQLPNGQLEIIDYKTGKSKETLVGDDKDQLLIYQIAATTLPKFAHIGAVEKLTFYYLNDNIKTSFVGKTADIIKLQDKMLNTLQEIHQGNFSATPNQFACSYCDFRDMCDYRA